MFNSRENMKSAIPREQNCTTWLVKNNKTVFSKLMQKISLSVSSKQASKYSTSCFPFSDFQILSSLSGCYFRGISCTFHFGQMCNGFLTSTFDIYWSLALQFLHITVRLSECSFLFAVASNWFQQKMNFCNILSRSVSSSFSLLNVLDRPWHNTWAVACAHAITCTNQAKGSLHGQWKACPNIKLHSWYHPCKILNSLCKIYFNWYNRINFKLILLT